MREKFRDSITSNGQSFKWFYKEYIKDQIMDNNEKCKLTYSGFMQQINDYSPLSDFVKKQIALYMSK